MGMHRWILSSRVASILAKVSRASLDRCDHLCMILMYFAEVFHEKADEIRCTRWNVAHRMVRAAIPWIR